MYERIRILCHHVIAFLDFSSSGDSKLFEKKTNFHIYIEE